MSEKKNPANNRLKLAIAVAILIGAIILIIATEWGSRTPPPGPPDPATTGSTATPPSTSAASPSPGSATPPTTAPVVVEPGPTPARAFFATPSAPPPPEERSALADALGSPDSDGRRDLAIVASLFTTYTDHFRELPIGSNAEITAALAGDNTRGLAVIPADHRAINAHGELVDRWGTPFFFHQTGVGPMEIRSAGPDRRLFTGDDLFTPPPEPLPEDFVP